MTAQKMWAKTSPAEALLGKSSVGEGLADADEPGLDLGASELLEARVLEGAGQKAVCARDEHRRGVGCLRNGNGGQGLRSAQEVRSYGLGRGDGT